MFYDKSIPDKNGDKIKLGDKVEHDEYVYEVIGFYIFREVIRLEVSDGNGYLMSSVDAREVTLVKPKETFDEIVEYLWKDAASMAITSRDDAERFGKRFINCEEASHE